MAFRGKVAFVTGAASGLGRLAARRLAASGAVVVAADIDEPGLADTARHAPNIATQALDVTNEASVAGAVRDVEGEHGGIDRLVHAAAIAPSGLLLDQPPELIRRVMEVDYGGTVNVVHAVVPGMVERDRGDLVVFASLAGWLPAPRLGAYTASKFAVVAMTEVLAMELGHTRLRVCCACPPLVDTPLLEQIAPDFPLEGQPKLRPEVVLDAIERALESGDLFAFPGPAAAAVVARRFAPRQVRKRMARLLL